jgi:hypothetical protein
MPDAPLETIARYPRRGDAQLAKTRLEDAGIPCMLANEDQSGLATMFESSQGGVQVKVPAAQADEARSIVNTD